MDGLDLEDWGYAYEGTKEIYQYVDRLITCFIKDADEYEWVYFDEGNILFQITFRSDDEESHDPTPTKEQTKELLDLFGREN